MGKSLVELVDFHGFRGSGEARMVQMVGVRVPLYWPHLVGAAP